MLCFSKDRSHSADLTPSPLCSSLLFFSLSCCCSTFSACWLCLFVPCCRAGERRMKRKTRGLSFYLSAALKTKKKERSQTERGRQEQKGRVCAVLHDSSFRNAADVRAGETVVCVWFFMMLQETVSDIWIHMKTVESLHNKPEKVVVWLWDTTGECLSDGWGFMCA